jgi:hypothetical protein
VRDGVPMMTLYGKNASAIDQTSITTQLVPFCSVSGPSST